MIAATRLGTGIETRIRDLAETIREVVGYEGKTVWDTSRPDVRLHLRGIGRRAPGATSAE